MSPHLQLGLLVLSLAKGRVKLTKTMTRVTMSIMGVNTVLIIIAAMLEGDSDVRACLLAGMRMRTAWGSDQLRVYSTDARALFAGRRRAATAHVSNAISTRHARCRPHLPPADHTNPMNHAHSDLGCHFIDMANRHLHRSQIRRSVSVVIRPQANLDHVPHQLEAIDGRLAFVLSDDRCGASGGRQVDPRPLGAGHVGNREYVAFHSP